MSFDHGICASCARLAFRHLGAGVGENGDAVPEPVMRRLTARQRHVIVVIPKSAMRCPTGSSAVAKPGHPPPSWYQADRLACLETQVTRPPGIPQSHVVVKNLVKTYPNGHCAVDSVSMEINAGEVVSIIGPSGAGKSTFLRCINLLETPTRGSVSVGDQTLVFDAATKHVKRDALQRFRRGVGMVFQSFNLYPHMTILRNVTLPQQKVLGVSRARAEEVGLAMLDRVGLANRANSYPSQCSGGQQQRAAIARALALQPHLMLFDEPTSALDPEVGVEVLGIMKELAEGGMTMMVVTHEMDFARHVSDRVVIMVDGAVLEEGAPGRVMDAPEHERSQRFLSAVFGR